MATWGTRLLGAVGAVVAAMLVASIRLATAPARPFTLLSGSGVAVSGLVARRGG